MTQPTQEEIIKEIVNRSKEKIMLTNINLKDILDEIIKNCNEYIANNPRVVTEYNPINYYDQLLTITDFESNNLVPLDKVFDCVSLTLSGITAEVLNQIETHRCLKEHAKICRASAISNKHLDISFNPMAHDVLSDIDEMSISDDKKMQLRFLKQRQLESWIPNSSLIKMNGIQAGKTKSNALLLEEFAILSKSSHKQEKKAKQTAYKEKFFSKRQQTKKVKVNPLLAKLVAKK